MPDIQSISAVTVTTSNMARAVRFYKALGLRLAYGAATATAELHVEHLGDKAVPHHITIKDPPHAGEQLQLP